ncbi:hypothetical protein [Halobacterium litoreum]|uniref:Etoposide-induced protein 2.4 (EI24) n=1 Tax=Halobacterium litoreum TaxID=2039234 RepID=A0ABD5NHV6_9EURY|nr:hypothetical protein [Halobacterium litoreum]UHH12312.1 hypothetical protein LT972_09090 [Halobacterium litoreum]
MPSTLSRAGRIAGRVAPLAVVPFALSLLAFEKVTAVASTHGTSISVKFALPADVATLWTLVDPPTQGVAVHSPVPLLFVPVFLAVEAAVVAGYLGSIRDAYRDRRPDFVGAAGDYWLSILGVRVAQFLLFVGLALAAVGGGVVGVLFLIPLIFLLGYLLWAAPYLVVLRDADALTALSASANLGAKGGRYLAFSVGYAVVAAGGSLVVSPLVTSSGLTGVLVGAALVAYPSLVGSAAATVVVDEVAAAVESRGA